MHTPHPNPAPALMPVPGFLKKLPRWVRKTLLYLFALAFWFFLWWVAARRMDQPLLLPSPAEVLSRLLELSLTAAFWKTVGTSLLRILAGILWGIAAGALMALFTHFIPPLYALFYPLITVIRATPVASFIILAYLWMSRDTLPTFISVLIVLPVVWSNLHEALGATDRDLLEMARVFRFSPQKKLLRLYLPSLLPAFMASVRSSVGLAWKAGIAAEVLTVPAISIGRHLADAKLYLETTDLFAWTLAVILLSLVAELAMLSLLRLTGRKQKRATTSGEGARV